ncbi:hypothetical protein [Stenotrophomonas acidaminiphila]|uniref:hypothetical protein n=1 Tax=Stenotrophomonas acidaminiphila TaxID=128780 RepID=UPI003D000005
MATIAGHALDWRRPAARGIARLPAHPGDDDVTGRSRRPAWNGSEQAMAAARSARKPERSPARHDGFPGEQRFGRVAVERRRGISAR